MEIAGRWERVLSSWGNDGQGKLDVTQRKVINSNLSEDLVPLCRLGKFILPSTKPCLSLLVGCFLFFFPPGMSQEKPRLCQTTEKFPFHVKTELCPPWEFSALSFRSLCASAIPELIQTLPTSCWRAAKGVVISSLRESLLSWKLG